MANFTALYDANVLYPSPLRNLLMHLALSGLYRAKWTNHIHEEWIRNLLNNRKDLTREKLERIRDLMNEHTLDCLVTGYEDIIPSIHLPDPNDRHVLAAAIISNTSVIVTYNVKDFPEKSLNKYDIEVQHPDDFLMHLIDLSFEKVCIAIRQSRLILDRPGYTQQEYLNLLSNQKLHSSVKELEKYLELI